MQNFEDIQNLIRDDLNSTDQVLIDNLSSDVALINQMSSYIIGAGGKRIRPLLLLLCARASNYQGKHHHLMAVVIELIHTATLLHDDIVDESSTRRGKDTANEVWGNSPSVLVGDFLYSRAFEMMVKPDSMRIMQLLAKATNEIAQGEVMQLLNCQNSKRLHKLVGFYLVLTKLKKRLLENTAYILVMHFKLLMMYSTMNQIVTQWAKKLVTILQKGKLHYQ